MDDDALLADPATVIESDRREGTDEGHIGGFAAEHLSPVLPAARPVGHRPAAARLAGGGPRPLLRPRRPGRTGNGPRDFLAAATPGAGKTTFALRLASELMRRRVIERIVVVAPTEHLKTQWADAAARVGIRLDPSFSNRHVAACPPLSRRRGDLRAGRGQGIRPPATDRRPPHAS